MPSVNRASRCCFKVSLEQPTTSDGQAAAFFASHTLVVAVVPLKRAEQELLLREEIEDEPVIIAPNWSSDEPPEIPADDNGLEDMKR
ncbi:MULTISPECIES: hypothetical protein [unclassified Ruegeria]|uniref:hypothetical protein n=1 Tax=unclassified Ruegeria TaxID=2625375 RepID=UPI001ADB5333|nr:MULTISPECIES: hypothetical protein [unclassified Ruegeria]MBO9412397.1 hypothetical protein [Ruegeria sp. R8_1]MBO9416365.1 hypothetical protein [Ruegeria sp. R8_2]